LTVNVSKDNKSIIFFKPYVFERILDTEFQKCSIKQLQEF
jgi:hypothetical protein